jgi:hypothetical protein
VHSIRRVIDIVFSKKQSIVFAQREISSRAWTSNDRKRWKQREISSRAWTSNDRKRWKRSQRVEYRYVSSEVEVSGGTRT